MTFSPRHRWSRDELLVALNIYHKLPFSMFDAKRPVIFELAKKLGRTPGSLAMKLCNFASLDPVQKLRGIKGLSGASRLDEALWAEFHAAPQSLGPESEALFQRLFTKGEDAEAELTKDHGIQIKRTPLMPPSGPTDRVSEVTVRRGQQFFRQMILNAFDGRCCITSLPIREFLVASHILPWGKFPAERLNPQNGLCLSRLHDVAFDRGFITFDDGRQLVLSNQLRAHLPQPAIEQNFVAYEATAFAVPTDAPGPSDEFLRHHREYIFRR